MGAVGNAVRREPWSKGEIVGQKAPFKLKDIWVRVPTDAGPSPRTCSVQSRHRSKLRGCESRPPYRPGRVSRQPGSSARGRDAARDSAPCAVRDHTGYPGRRTGVDRASWAQIRRLRVLQPHPRFAASGDTPVRKAPWWLSGRGAPRTGLSQRCLYRNGTWKLTPPAGPAAAASAAGSCCFPRLRP